MVEKSIRKSQLLNNNFKITQGGFKKIEIIWTTDGLNMHNPFKETECFFDIGFLRCGLKMIKNKERNKWALRVMVKYTKFWLFQFTKPQFLKRNLTFIRKTINVIQNVPVTLKTKI